jgi:hypothetical protein
MMVTKRDTASGRFYRLEEFVSILTGTSDFPSVTHILSAIAKPALVTWAANTERAAVSEAAAELYLDAAVLPKPMTRDAFLASLNLRLGEVKAHKRENEKALEVGSQAHTLIEWASRRAIGQVVGPEPKVRDEALWPYMAWEDWVKTHKVRPVAIEQVVWSNEYGYAGTMDLLAEVDGELALVDYKTGKAIYEESFLQNVAYQVALAEMGHGTPKRGYIVRLPKLTSDPAFEVVEVPPVSELFPVFLNVCQVWKWWWAADQRSKAAWQAKKNGVAA